jgi:hypothetical protein
MADGDPTQQRMAGTAISDMKNRAKGTGATSTVSRTQ